ncbi:MAG: hypothetical protein AAGI91_17520, partial [Bacteroidota bacterium]
SARPATPFVQAHADRRRAAEALWREEERETYGEGRSDVLRPAGEGTVGTRSVGSASVQGDPDQLTLF